MLNYREKEKEMDKFSLRKKLTNALNKNENTEIEEEAMVEENNEEVVAERGDNGQVNESQDDFIETSEGLTLEDVLFPGGPTIGEIEEWKKIHGEIYLTTINDDVYIWRPLTRKELKEVHTATSGVHQREETYCKICNLWPSDYDFTNQHEKAGVPSVLSEQILLKSGFQALQIGRAHV